ncbi:hypothetical protein AgCh_013879 [Apium graveolens]
MGAKRSNESYCSCVSVFLAFILIFEARILYGYTNPVDVAAINSFYISVGSPFLPRWTSVGGDPCGDAWQGVECDSSNISSIKFNVANMQGDLGDSLGSFASIKIIDLSNNQIGGSIPKNLPVSLQQLYLSDNKFTGSIPSSLSSINQLSAMSLNGNQLTGEIPDSFQGLTVLVNLDLSSNNLTGQLPPSLEGLSSLTTFRLQNNQLSGTLDVLQDLPLRDLNVENNRFSGPIPEKLLSIPIFKSDGNPFNTSVAPSSPPTPPTGSPTMPTARPPAPPFFVVPTTGQPPERQAPGKVPPSRPADGPSTTKDSNRKKTTETSNTKKIVWISIGTVLSVVILLLLLVLFIPRCCRERNDRIPRRHEIAPYIGNRDNLREYGPLVHPFHQTEKVPKTDLVQSKDNYQKVPLISNTVPKPRKEEVNVDTMSAAPKAEAHEIDMAGLDYDSMLPPPPPPPPSPPPFLSPPAPPPVPFEDVIVNPIVPTESIPINPSRPLPPTTVRSYSIASLQQYTNSFSQDNLIGGGMLGNVYTAKLPNGKLVAVKKLDRRVSSQLKDDEFLDLVNSIDKIRHANVVEILGYCAELGQRLLVYEYCSNGTLQDILLSDDESKPSWNLRIRMALGAARALEYLHEFCEPPVVHRNFKSSNILLDDELTVHVSDCGLAPLILSGSVSQSYNWKVKRSTCIMFTRSCQETSLRLMVMAPPNLSLEYILP